MKNGLAYENKKCLDYRVFLVGLYANSHLTNGLRLALSNISVFKYNVGSTSSIHNSSIHISGKLLWYIMLIFTVHLHETDLIASTSFSQKVFQPQHCP